MRGRLVTRVLLAWIIFGAVLAAVLSFTASEDSGVAADGDVVDVRVGRHEVSAEVAATDRSRTRGLAGRKPLAPGEGMVFVFDSVGPRDFWMRGVSFPLDMIWILNGRVAGITRDARPVAETGQRLYHSPGKIDRVLEVPGGWAAARKVRAGASYRGP
jgi:uncharacterized protein